VTLLVELGEIRTAAGDYPAAIEAFESAAGRAPDALLPPIEVRLGRAHARRRDLVAAASHLDAAIDALDEAGTDRPTLVRALIERGLVASLGGDPGRSRVHAERARILAEADGDVAAAGAADRILGLAARASGDGALAERALRRSLELAAEDPDPGAEVAAGNALALVVAERGDRAEAIVLLEAALLACRRTGELHLEAAVENNLADQLHAVGREDEAMTHLKRAVALFADIGARPSEHGAFDPAIWMLVTW
jgi:tetratricopeptide (TPR) repeat protein